MRWLIVNQTKKNNKNKKLNKIHENSFIFVRTNYRRIKITINMNPMFISHCFHKTVLFHI